ncbi:hypothetical protein NB037_09795 [Rathayibacter sp. ZW T2_19]|uniref:Phosphodiesterase n=1 Tax=Rathayibacter rubneri TaxID=2950106 RepID=A0A9X2DWZ1_9MICO|nr:hypothetical protein [Rathayibacter rubneri]MCM6762707.1 hypothetical protein [Rathayibacter rubneri]
MRERLRSAAVRAAGVAGAVLGVAVGLVHRVRRRPLHPAGVALTGTIRPLDPREASGPAWLDGVTGPMQVRARLSRGAGLPALLPDVLGVALQLHDGDATGRQIHLLFSSTGRSPVGRFLLLPRRRASGAFLSTLMPFRSEHGPVLLAVEASSSPELPADLVEAARVLESESWRLRLLQAAPRGAWRPVADVVLGRAPHDPVDSARRSDPVLFAPPGDTTYAWTRLLRGPSYRAARE